MDFCSAKYPYLAYATCTPLYIQQFVKRGTMMSAALLFSAISRSISLILVPNDI